MRNYSLFPSRRQEQGLLRRALRAAILVGPRREFGVSAYSGPVARLSGTLYNRTTAEPDRDMAARRSPVISFASTKGGVGKTTLAFVLATAFARRLSGQSEYRISCIDADPNGTLDVALKKAAFPEILSSVSDAESLLARLREAQKSADLVLIDLEGSANQAMLYAAGKSDLVVIPAQPSAYDVREARRTASVVQQAADLVGRPIPMTVVLTRAPVLRQRIADHARNQFLQAGLPILSVELVQRVAFQTMTYTGEPPFVSDPHSGAALNVDALANAIAGLIGITLESRRSVEKAA